MIALNSPCWLGKSDDVDASSELPFKPSATVIKAYANDIEKHGRPLDSGLPSYFRRCAEYYDQVQEGEV